MKQSIAIQGQRFLAASCLIGLVCSCGSNQTAVSIPLPYYDFPTTLTTCRYSGDNGPCTNSYPRCALTAGKCAAVGNSSSYACMYATTNVSQTTCSCYEGEVRQCYTSARVLGVQKCIMDSSTTSHLDVCNPV
jgi:hypothetical protein